MSNYPFHSTQNLRDSEIYLGLIEQLQAEQSHWLLPAYRFHIYKIDTDEKVGYISFRVGNNELSKYSGHIGYAVFPPHHGHSYSLKAVRIILEFAKEHNMEQVTITANPDNRASLRIIESAGGQFETTANIPEELFDYYPEEERQKCIYHIKLSGK